MPSHSAIHDEMLERLVVGDLPRTSAEARTVLDGCEICREKLREFERLQSDLARVGQEEREGLEQSSSVELTPALERGLEQFAESRMQRRASPRWLRAAALAVAASVVAAIGYQVYSRATMDDPRHEDVPLSPDQVDVTLILPEKEHVGKWEEFAWSSRTLDADETFTLRMRNLDPPGLASLVVDTIKTTQWKRSEARRVDKRRVEEFFAREPRRIEWSVDIRKNSRFSGHSVPRQSALD